MAKSNNWTKEETIVAFNVYCKIPFKKSSKTNPTIIKYANIIGRSTKRLFKSLYEEPTSRNKKQFQIHKNKPNYHKDSTAITIL